MLNVLIEWDTALFYLFNQKLQNPVFDVLMPFITEIKNWRIIIGLAWFALLIWGGKKGRIVALLAAITLALSDQTSSHLLKPLIGRVRPCNALNNVHLLVSCTGSFSFPSSHATNIFAMATLFSHYYKNLKVYFYIIAILVSYSRIYVGVHYPLDVLGGMLLGMLCATLIILLTKVDVGKLVEKIKP